MASAPRSRHDPANVGCQPSPACLLGVVPGHIKMGMSTLHPADKLAIVFLVKFSLILLERKLKCKTLYVCAFLIYCCLLIFLMSFKLKIVFCPTASSSVLLSNYDIRGMAEHG